MRRCLALLVFAGFALPLLAEDAPQFRGPGGRGVSQETGLPTFWSQNANLRWKAALPGRGLSGPVVANGRVYVASYKELAIFAPGTGSTAPQTAQALSSAPSGTTQPLVPDSAQLPPDGHEIFGEIKSVDGNMITIATRKGAPIDVDATQAVQDHQSVVLLRGEAVRILGSYNAANIFEATTITRAKRSPKLWPPDR